MRSLAAIPGSGRGGSGFLSGRAYRLGGLLHGSLFDKPIEISPLKEYFLPDPDVRQFSGLYQFEKRISADAEGLEGLPESQEFCGHRP